MAKKPDTEAKVEQKQGTQTKRGRVENLRPWKKGQSGNPGGQPKGLVDVRRYSRGFSIEAIDKLVHWMRSDDSRASISAAVAILNRGWGMPQQNISATISDIRAMTDAELTEYLVIDAEPVQSGDSPRALAPPGDTEQPDGMG